MDDLNTRMALQNLNNYYADVCDRNLLDETVNCWTVDGIFDERDAGTRLCVGHDELRAYFADVVFGLTTHLVHIMTNQVITDITETTAKGSAFTVLNAVFKNGVWQRVGARYTDEFSKVDGQWKFASRVVKIVLPWETVTNWQIESPLG